MSLTGFLSGNTFVKDEHLEAVSLVKDASGWVISVFLRYPDGNRQAYVIHRGDNESEARQHLKSFLSRYEVNYIDENIG